MDSATALGERLVYARCFMGIVASKTLPKQVTVGLEVGEQVEIRVEYEWLPPLCSKYTNFGYTDNQCPTVQLWRPQREKVPVHQKIERKGKSGRYSNRERERVQEWIIKVMPVVFKKSSICS